MRILLVEDTPEIGAAVTSRFERIGYAVDWEKDGRTASELIEVQTYDLIVLDVMLPNMDGFAVLKHLRKRGLRTPVLVLTARSAVDDRIGALDLGADDYLIKPFDYRELEARARALLRRAAGQSDNLLTLGPLVIDRAGRTASVAGRPLRRQGGVGRAAVQLRPGPEPERRRAVHRAAAPQAGGNNSRNQDRARPWLSAPRFVTSGHRCARGS